MTNLTCRELIEFLDDYVEGRLPPERRAVFDDHIFQCCQDCRDYLESYRRTIELTRELGQAVSVGEVPEAIARAVRAAIALSPEPGAPRD